MGYLSDLTLGGPADVVARDVMTIKKVGGDMGLEFRVHLPISQCQFFDVAALLHFL
jgi:hypothetical protein